MLRLANNSEAWFILGKKYAECVSDTSFFRSIHYCTKQRASRQTDADIRHLRIARYTEVVTDLLHISLAAQKKTVKPGLFFGKKHLKCASETLLFRSIYRFTSQRASRQTDADLKHLQISRTAAAFTDKLKFFRASKNNSEALFFFRWDTREACFRHFVVLKHLQIYFWPTERSSEKRVQTKKISIV